VEGEYLRDSTEEMLMKEEETRRFLMKQGEIQEREEVREF
jgi:hypothetical protein